MIMKIIERGNRIFECDVCGCKFALDKYDTIRHYNGYYSNWEYFIGDYKSKDYDYVLCPQCGQQVKVTRKEHIE